MNKFAIIFGTLLGAGLLTAQAQTSYGAARLMGSDLNGTARYVGMGGAMGALGGDISTISTNPAGIGLFRTFDASITGSINTLASKSRSLGFSDKDDRTFGNFDQVGFVLSFGGDEFDSYLNVGFNYHLQKSFYKNFSMMTELDGTSQMWQMTNSLYRFEDEAGVTFPLDDIRSDDYRYPFAGSGRFACYVPWLTLLGGDAELLDVESGEPLYNSTSGYYHSRERGGIQVFDMNMSGNINNILYLGLTVGIYDVNYNRYSYYDEYYGNDFNYSLENWYKTEGEGFDVKLGAILSPLEDNSLRFGFAVHTPVWYRLTDINSAYIYSDPFGDSPRDMDTQSYDAYGGDYYTDYRLRTPWKFNFSAGYVLDDKLALGAEYEFADYSTANLKYDDGSNMSAMNDQISENLTGVNTLKLGAELNVLPQLALRAGFNHRTAMFNRSAYQELPLNSVQTDTEYFNSFHSNDFTFGLGYSGDVFYADFAYKYSHSKGNFYPFDDYCKLDDGSILTVPATKVSDNRHTLMLTVGMSF